MAELIKKVRNAHRIEFDQGRFDKWCVYLERKGKPRYAPLDLEYFEFFLQQANRCGASRVYESFVQIYTPTSSIINPHVLNLITSIADSYGHDAVEMDIWLSVIYGSMIAEENKANMILKKRIKRLGMYQVLIQNLPPSEAARFSKGKKWKELDGLMTGYGF